MVNALHLEMAGRTLIFADSLVCKTVVMILKPICFKILWLSQAALAKFCWHLAVFEVSCIDISCI